MTAIPSSSSTVSEFIEYKLSEFETEKFYTTCLAQGLQIMMRSGTLTTADYLGEIHPILRTYRNASTNLDLLERRQSSIQQDLLDDVQDRRDRLIGPVDVSAEQSYMSHNLLCVIKAARYYRKISFNRRIFKKRVMERYLTPAEWHRMGSGPCYELSGLYHIYGGYPVPERRKISHIVPKFLHKAELSHLFGVGEDVAQDSGNAIPLDQPLESLLDRGILAIVPASSAVEDLIWWRCIVVQDTYREAIAFKKNTEPLLWVKDLDGEELAFLSVTKPRARYMYFRFILSYLNAKRLDLNDVVQRMENETFWAPGGRYLRKSTINTIAQMICGSELPPKLIQNCFDTDDESGDIHAGMVLAADLPPELIQNCFDTDDESGDIHAGMVLAADLRDMMYGQDKTKSKFDRRVHLIE